MATSPASRYASAADLGREVERWLADEPVEAYRDPLVERMRRWGRRHRSLVSGAAVLLVAGVVALGVGLWAVGREQARTKQALGEAEENLAQAEANLRLARQAVDECFNVAKEHPLFKPSRMEKAKKLLLEKTLPFYRQFRSKNPDDVGLQSDEAEQFVRVAYIQNELGHFDEGLVAFRRAQQIQMEMVESHPEVPRYRYYLATTHNSLGVMLASLGKCAEAIKEYRCALDLQKKLVKDQPQAASYRNSLAGTHSNLALIFDELGKREEAKQHLRQSLDLQIKLAEDFPDAPQYQQAVANNFANMAVMLEDVGKREEALRVHQQARAIRSKLVKTFPDSLQHQQDLASTHNNLGVLFCDQEKYPEALQEHQQALVIRGKLARDNPDVPRYQLDLSTTHNNLGALFFDMGKYNEALEQHHQARKIRSKLVEDHTGVPEYRQDLAASHYNCGMTLSSLGKQEDALQEYHRARTLQSKLVNDHPKGQAYLLDLARTCLQQGATLSQLNQLDKALGHLDTGVRLADRLLRVDPRHPQAPSYLVTGLRERAKALMRMARYRDAQADWTRALTITPAFQQLELHLERATALAHSWEYRRAAEAADALQQGMQRPEVLCQLATVYSLAAAGSARDGSRPLPERENRAEQYARKAVALLKRAAATGHFRHRANLANLDGDCDLSYLRPREDYRRFRMGLKPRK
jgi:tetratricopeptide (TPR) repeat protein